MTEAHELRLAAWDLKTSSQSAALSALRRLAVSAGHDPDQSQGHGAEWLFESRIRPMVDVRCGSGHKLAGVWRTDEGAVFVAWPEVSLGSEARAGRWTVTGAHGSRRRLIADLLHEDGKCVVGLLVSCDCGPLHALDDVGSLLLAYSRALASKPQRYVVDVPRVAWSPPPGES